MSTNYGRNYERIRSDYYGFRRLNSEHLVQRLFRPLARGLALRYWYSRVLHGISLGTSSSRRPLGRNALTTTRKLLASFGTLSLVLLGGLASVPNNADAAIVSSNYEATTTSVLISTIGAVSIKAGTGIQTGIVPTSITYSMLFEGTGNGSIKAFIRCYTSSLYNTQCSTGPATQDLFSASTTVSGAGTYSFAFSSSTWTFDSTKYYAIGALNYGSGGSSGFRWFGTGTPVNGNGDCLLAGNFICSGSGGYPLGAVYFILNAGSSGSTLANGIQSIITPTYGSLITNGFGTPFSFTYYGGYGLYDRVGFLLKDNTAFQSIDTSSLESGAVQNSITTYSSVFNLITGHNYTWVPYIRDSIGSSTILYGPSTFFFTGTNQSTQLPASPYNPFASSTLISGPLISTTSAGIYTFQGTSTTSWFAGILDAQTEELLATKAPFSYLYDFKRVFLELANGSATSGHTCASSDAYYTLPTGVFGSTLSNGSTSVKLIDACAVSNFSTTQQIRQAVGYAIYIMTGIGLVGMAMSIF